MFCTNCGAQVAPNAVKCPECGTSRGAAAASAALSAVRESGAIKGLLVLILSFFTMPLKTARLAIHQLREIGGAGALQLGATTLPHLSWLRVAANVLISVLIACILIYGLYEAFSALGALDYSVKKALQDFVWELAKAVGLAMLADWVLGVAVELLSVLIVISNDVRVISNRSG